MAAAQNVAAAAASGGSVLAEPPPAADPALEGPRMIRQYGGLSMIVPKAK
jgi:hypothetical protein